MALSYVLDTSVVTRLGVDAVRARVEALDNAGVARSSMTDLEVGYWAQSVAEWDRLMTALEVFEVVEMRPADFVRARQVQRMLAGRGLKGCKVTDLLIAAAGEAAGLTVLHYDADFGHIASVTGQPTEWVVPTGTID